jgi:F0F1-type ATP synthase assembly protein I
VAFSRLAQLPGKVIQKMCQAGLLAFAVLGVISFLWNVCQNQNGQVIKSLALGVALWLLPNSYFAIKIMCRLGQVPGRDLLNIFYRAELIKLFFSGIFFIMAIKLLSVNIPILLLAYLASQLIFWLLLIIKSSKGLL